MTSPKEKEKRIYQPAWELLKTEGKCFIKCRNRQQQTIIKAIQKEKYMDPDKYAFGKIEVTRMKSGVKFSMLIPVSAKDM